MLLRQIPLNGSNLAARVDLCTRSLIAASMRQGGANESDYLDTVISINRNTGAVDAFRHGDDHLIEEHSFIPRPGATNRDDGWLIGTAMDCRASAPCLASSMPGVWQMGRWRRPPWENLVAVISWALCRRVIVRERTASGLVRAGSGFIRTFLAPRFAVEVQAALVDAVQPGVGQAGGVSDFHHLIHRRLPPEAVVLVADG